MSLSRILNDDGPGPQTPKQPVQVSAPIPVRSIEPAFIDTPRRSPSIHVPYDQGYRHGSRGIDYGGANNHNLVHDRSPSPRYYSGNNNDHPPPLQPQRRLTQSPPPHWNERSASSSKRISPALSRGPESDAMSVSHLVHPSEVSYDRRSTYEPPTSAHYATEQPRSHSRPYHEDWQDEAPSVAPPMQPNDAPPLDPTPRSGGRTRKARASATTNKGDASTEPAPKRRRKATDEQSVDTVHRYPTRKMPPRKQYQTDTPTSLPPPEQIAAPPTAEELRLASSDLDDCEEVWLQELGDYVLETQKRNRQVEGWFIDSCVARNNEAARTMSRQYSARISQIPVRPPRPQFVPPPPMERSISSRMPRSPSPVFPDENGLGLEFHEYKASRRYSGDYNAAEDVAREVEESILGHPSSPVRHRRDYAKSRKRDAAAALSDAESDFEIPGQPRFDQLAASVLKKRRLDNGVEDITEDLERSVAGDDIQSISGVVAKKSVGKGKGKARGTPPVAPPALSTVPSGASEVASGVKVRKKPGPKKKSDLLALRAGETRTPSAAASVAGDATPAGSLPPSPSMSTAIIYEMGDPVVPMKKAKRVDDQTMMKRISALEEAQKKVWLNIARRDVAKVYKVHVLGYQARQNMVKRIASLCSTQAKRPLQRTTKSTKDVQTKAKRLMREMMVFWKKNEKEERDLRKRAEKEADNRAKEEEERREATRQARKLEFLISQTELYSHFVGRRLKTSELEGETADQAVPKGAEGDDKEPTREIDFDDEDETNLHAHARKNAQNAISMAKKMAVQFDAQAALDRKTNEALALAKAQAHIRDDDDELVESGKEKSGTGLVDLDSDELNFQNPTSLTGPLTIGQPRMLQAQLKEYQLKGLNWLGTLYEQGINGILADEMGLGKTVQSISLLAHLAETHDIWGPFLVVAPASTLHNWQQELTRFVPKLKALPYWGNVKDRATLRKFWSKKEISYNEDAPFHVLITSYQLITQDQQYFQRVKWQYMILDEAQNIKNSSSARWKTLLGFHCRNRLLLTGTPIQNNMQELWALLHFIMPSLFDSHDEFNEWFSKDIENAAAENRGSKLNEHQLRRLHMILKPFMLRRVKKHVQNELSEKIEIDIYVDLSARQRALYRTLRANVSVADLLEKAANIGDAEAARTLMNLVMQFRKVCNHPELFERADVVAPFSFCEFGRTGSIAREGDSISCQYSTRSLIEFPVPELFYLDGGIFSVPTENSQVQRPEGGILRNLMSIWSTDWMKKSIEENTSSPFNFTRLTDTSLSEIHSLYYAPGAKRSALIHEQPQVDSIVNDPYFGLGSARPDYVVSPHPDLRWLNVADGSPALSDITRSMWSYSILARPGLRWYVPPVVAPPPALSCTDRTFMDRENHVLECPLESLMLHGLPQLSAENPSLCKEFEMILPGIPPTGLLQSSPTDQLPLSYMQVPEAKRLIYDSAKLAKLDALLHELKAGDHRVLVYFQMTRMMDLMEEYLIYRQYKYLRLDGSSKIEDRRDMVMDWQTKPDIFVFLLSTRAGGLGINLTAADTVIFYDHDWNPSNDAQAMDRAHRLGQTRQVTVYRLITKGTIDERIVQLARVKKDVQDIVVGNKQFTEVAKPKEIVSLLLNDDELANLEKQGSDNAIAARSHSRKAAGSTNETSQAVREMWNEEGDDFFGQSGPAPNMPTTEGGEDEEREFVAPVAKSTRGRKRGGGAGRGRGRGRGKRRHAGDSLPDDI